MVLIQTALSADELRPFSERPSARVTARSCITGVVARIGSPVFYIGGTESGP